MEPWKDVSSCLYHLSVSLQRPLLWNPIVHSVDKGEKFIEYWFKSTKLLNEIHLEIHLLAIYIVLNYPQLVHAKARYPELNTGSHLRASDTSSVAIACYFPRWTLAESWIRSGGAKTPTRHSTIICKCLSSDLSATPHTFLS